MPIHKKNKIFKYPITKIKALYVVISMITGSICLVLK